jgi:hypothetical protein
MSALLEAAANLDPQRARDLAANDAAARLRFTRERLAQRSAFLRREGLAHSHCSYCFEHRSEHAKDCEMHPDNIERERALQDEESEPQ